jgi:hypothetical protein
VRVAAVDLSTELKVQTRTGWMFPGGSTALVTILLKFYDSHHGTSAYHQQDVGTTDHGTS